MKTKLLYQVHIVLSITALAVVFPFHGRTQTSVDLNLNHHFDGDYFQYGTVYQFNGTAVQFNRVQYYLCGFNLVHDGGQNLFLPDTYLLCSGNVTNYSLGQQNVSTLEGLSFSLGVDSLRNSMGTSFWPPGHPLASQTPIMDWAWPSGYVFWAIEGFVDNTGDGVPNKNFQLHGIGHHLFTDVDPFSGWSNSGSAITVELFVNVADWLVGLDLDASGIAHNGGPVHVAISRNTNDYTVFTTDEALSLSEAEIVESKIYADYTMPYAPTIYYDLNTKQNVNIEVYNASGQLVLTEKEQIHQGNFFIRRELEDGVYIITFKNSGLHEQYRFVVRN